MKTSAEKLRKYSTADMVFGIVVGLLVGSLVATAYHHNPVVALDEQRVRVDGHYEALHMEPVTKGVCPFCENGDIGVFYED